MATTREGTFVSGWCMRGPIGSRPQHHLCRSSICQCEDCSHPHRAASVLDAIAIKAQLDRNEELPPIPLGPPPPPSGDFECCASGSCEVCRR